MATGPMNQVIHQLRNLVLRNGEEPGDGKLLDCFIKDREEAALEALIRRHGAMVWGVCRRVLGNHHDVEDAFQATFLVLVRKASSIKPRDMVGSWLYGVARQTALKAWANSVKRQMREKQVTAMPEPAAGPIDRADNLTSLLDQELSRLPDKYRAVIVLCELEGRPLKDAAQHLGVPEGTVASRLARGRIMLAKRLARHQLAVSSATLSAFLAQQASAAGVPPLVLSATIKSANLLAAGSAMAGAVSPTILALCDGVLRTMLLNKLTKWTAITLLILLTAGAGYVGYAASIGFRGRDEDNQQAFAPKKDLEPITKPKDPFLGPNKDPEAIKDKKAALKILDVRFKNFGDDDPLQLPEDIDGLLMRGRRGYGSNTITDAGIKHLTRFTKLRILAAGGLELSDRVLETIGKLTTLEELSLDSNNITGTGLRHLKGLKHLRKLDLNFNKIDPETLEALADLPALTSLQINGTGVVNDRLCELCSRLKNLKELLLFENTSAVTDRGLEHLAKLKHLENVVLGGSRKITEAGIAAIAGLRHLKTLRLRELQSVTPAGMKRIGQLTELLDLEIDYVPMDEDSVRALAPLTKVENFLLWSVTTKPLPLDSLGELRSLRRFRTNMPVSSSAIRRLARLQDLESITDELYEITDDDLTHLSKLPKLQILVLGSDKITAASLPTLAKMKSLRELFMTEKVGISPEQWTALGRDSLPECNISRFRPPYTVFHKRKE